MRKKNLIEEAKFKPTSLEERGSSAAHLGSPLPEVIPIESFPALTSLQYMGSVLQYSAARVL